MPTRRPSVVPMDAPREDGYEPGRSRTVNPQIKSRVTPFVITNKSRDSGDGGGKP
jgi:hypothetical protein